MDSNTLSTLADLLKQPSSRSSTNTPIQETKSSSETNRPTIFDLPSCDRYRILRLIEELLDSQEEVDQLKQKVEEQKLEFREKRSALIKKLDILNEKHGKALSDIQCLKERHSESLKSLEKKISLVSLEFEKSAEEIAKLRKANEDLQKDNLELLKLNREVTSTIDVMQRENSKLSLELKESRHRERTFKHKLKHLSCTQMSSTFRPSERNQESGYSLPVDLEQSIKSPLDGNTGGISARNHGGSGDGDFLAQRRDLSTLGITTIKAPSKICSSHDLQTKLESTINLSPESIQPNTKQILCTTTNTESVDSLDAAIIESLFFRF